MILEKNKKKDLTEFVELCARVSDIDKDKASSLATGAIKYYRGDKTQRDALRVFQEIENRWYASVAAGSPDYSVYDDPYILVDIWACWILYSRKYLLMLSKKRVLTVEDAELGLVVSDQTIAEAMGSVSSVVDLGCGFGYTTAALKEIFTAADVYGTNFKGSCQWRLAEIVGAEHGFSMAPDAQSLGRKVDLVFASEYFEHVEDPVEHLVGIIAACEPRHLVIANSFGSTSTGHFPEYKHKGAEVKNKKIGRVFNRTLRELGYEDVQTKLWNHRPSWWRKRQT